MGITDFNKSLSTVRIKTYNDFFNTNNDQIKLSFIYLALQDITSSFYPLIQIMEITLRNRINDVLILEYGNHYWYQEMHLTPLTEKHFEAAKKRSKKKTKNHFICEIPFGAWVNLLDKPNRGALNDSELNKCSIEEKEKLIKIEKIWGKHIDTIFSGRGGKSMAAIFDHLKDVNSIRNRFSHYEPLWKPLKNADQIPLGEEFDAAIDTFQIKYDQVLLALNLCCPKTSDYIKSQTQENFHEKIKAYKDKWLDLTKN